MRIARLLWTLALLPAPGWGQSVALQGMLGNKALLIVNGSAPRALAPGESHQGVKVLSTRSDQAVVQVAGQRLTLRVGATPASVGAAPQAQGDRVVLTADARGHFYVQGSIRNKPARFMVDTGATVVTLDQFEADRLGLNYRAGTPVKVNTANGSADGWRLKIPSLRVGDITTYEVDAVVTPQPMPVVLLGNSFLARFDLRREGSQMTLIRR